MSKNYKSILLLLVVFTLGLYIGSNSNIFNSEPELQDLFEDNPLSTIYPSECTDDVDGAICNAVIGTRFSGENTTWMVDNGNCINSSIEVTFAEMKFIEFLTIEETVDATSDNVKEIQFEGTFGKLVVELSMTDDVMEWIDLNEGINTLKITINSIYESTPSSNDCGIENITFYGRDY